MVNEASNHLITSLDVQASSGHRNAEKLEMRAALYRAVRAAAAFAGVDPRAWHLEDRGDGQLIVLPSTTPRSRLLGRWLERLDTELRAHNTSHPRLPRVRARVGIHGGEVHWDEHGVAGTDVDIPCRLAGLPVVKATLREAWDADLIIVVSDPVYQSVVRPGGEFIDPTTYKPVVADLPEWRTTAWIRVPGHALPPLPDGLPEAEPEPDPEPTLEPNLEPRPEPGPAAGSVPPPPTGAGAGAELHHNKIRNVTFGTTNNYEAGR